jgi:ankyrin repeat protein
MPNVSEFQENIKKGDLDAVRTALENDPSLLDLPNEAGQSPYLLAKYYRQERVADYLLSLNPRLDVFNAAVAGDTGKVISFVEHNPELLEARSGDGWTLLHLAAFFGHPELGNALLDRGAEIEARSTNAMKNTPLHAAAAGGHPEMVETLLKRGASVDATQEGGWTALHSAAQAGNRQMVETLIAHGAEINSRAANQQSALDLALMKGHQDIANLLDQVGAKLR